MKIFLLWAFFKAEKFTVNFLMLLLLFPPVRLCLSVFVTNCLSTTKYGVSQTVFACVSNILFSQFTQWFIMGQILCSKTKYTLCIFYGCSDPVCYCKCVAGRPAGSGSGLHLINNELDRLLFDCNMSSFH